jgi:hypothetical protein
LAVGQGDDEFFVIFDACGRFQVILFLPLKFHEAGDFAHVLFLLISMQPGCAIAG